MGRPRSFKSIIHQLHLWSGLTMGIFLFLIAFSGTVLSYQKEIISILTPPVAVATPAPQLTLDQILVNVESTIGRPSILNISTRESSKLKVVIKSNPQERRGETYFISSDGKMSVKESGVLKPFFMFSFKLHRWLLFDTPVGRPIVGALTLLFTFLLFSGFYLWWPRTLGGLKRGLGLRLRAGGKRLNFDLHNTLGFYALPLMLLMALTGLCWSFESYRAGLSTLLDAQVFGGRGQESSKVEVLPIARRPLQELLDKSMKLYPEDGEWAIQLGAKVDESVVLSFQPEGAFVVRGRSRLEWNPYTGELIKQTDFSQKSVGEKIAALIHDLHTGDALGSVFKFLYFLASLVASSLPLTGALIWFNKKK